jgi:hypothetical protein
MTTKLTMIKEGGRLCPYGDVAWEEFDSIPHGKIVTVTVHQSRNPLHHAKLWALATKVANFDPEFQDAEHAVAWVKRMIPGMHKRYKMGDVLVIELKSINFESMDQIRFNRFYDRALWLWSERIGTDPEQLEQAA